MDALQDERRNLAKRLNADVLGPLKEAFVGKDEIIDLMGVCLVGGENLFILGPPGTAKSALVQELARRLDGRVFDYLLTRFTEPNELFGPFDIRRLRDGELVTNTDGMLPEAAFVFLDELLNANSAILNSLLMVLNERVFRRGRETRELPTLMVVGASNRLPDDDALGALFDRFLLRVPCDNVPHEQLEGVLAAGWKLDLDRDGRLAAMSVEDVRSLQEMISEVKLADVTPVYLELVHRLRHAGIAISDRRAVKLQRLVAASAVVCGRSEAQPTDLWVLRYIWDTEEQREVLASLVENAIDKTDPATQTRVHPRSVRNEAPDVESLARDLERIEQKLGVNELTDLDRTYLQDELSVLVSRCQWVDELQQRQFLEDKIRTLWTALGQDP